MNKVIKLNLAGLFFAVFAIVAVSPAVVLADHNYDNQSYNSSTIDKYAVAGQRIEFDIYAHDRDYRTSNYLNYWAVYLPAGAEFNKNTQVFSWTPQRAGDYLAKFRVSDGYDYADLEVAIHVENAPTPAYEYNSNNLVYDGYSPHYNYDDYNDDHNHNTNVVDSVPPKIIIVKSEPVTKYVYVNSNDSENNNEKAVDEEEECVSDSNEEECVGNEDDDEEEVNEDRITLADTFMGIIDNIILNPLFLLVLVIVLLIGLYVYRKRNRDLEQEINMRTKSEV